MKKITALKVLDNYRIWLRFGHGVEGEVDFSHKAHTGVYASWEDYAFFRRACIGHYGELRWNDQLDFGAESLWLRVSGRTAERSTRSHA